MKAPINSFELNKAITMGRVFSKVKISPASRLVLRCLIDFWNGGTGKAFPKQKTIAECTGLTRISVNNSVQELRDKDLIKTINSNNRLNYFLTDRLFSLISIKNKNYLPEVYKIFNSRSQECLHPNITNNIKKNKIKNPEKSIYPSVEETRRLIDSYKNLECASPYDDYSCALDWLASLDEETLKYEPIQRQVEKVKKLWNIE